MNNHYFIRYLLFFMAVILSGSGIALIAAAHIGITPISSAVWVLAFFTGSTLGIMTFFFNLLLIALQIMMLGLKEARNRLYYIVIQIPVLFIFSGAIDTVGYLLSGFLEPQPPYLQSWVLIVVGTLMLGFAIALEFMANVAMVPGEYFVKVLRQKVTNHSVGFLKTFFDISLVVIAVILSLIFSGFEFIEGVREGTVFCALATGPLVKLFIRVLKPLGEYLVPERVIRTA